jgi:hypothetical protein
MMMRPANEIHIHTARGHLVDFYLSIAIAFCVGLVVGTAFFKSLPELI